MKRQLVFSELAREEAAQAHWHLHTRSPQTGEEFTASLRTTQANIHAFPFSHAVSSHFGDLEIRRARIGRFAYFFFYLVYPSVDFQTGEALDVVAILGCRHERQAEPNWQSRDPFRL